MKEKAMEPKLRDLGWLRNVTGQWKAYHLSGDYYPACRGKKHSAGWAPPRWNVRFNRSSTYWCNDCLPAKYKDAADVVGLEQRRAIRIRKDGSVELPAKKQG